MNLDPEYYGRTNGFRKKHSFDRQNEEHQAMEKAALVFRQYLYDYAKILFNKSPHFIKQLTPKECGTKGEGLALFNSEMPPRMKNAKSVILKFLISRADVLIHKDEKENLKLLIDYVNSFTIEKEDI